MAAVAAAVVEAAAVSRLAKSDGAGAAGVVDTGAADGDVSWTKCKS